MTRKRVVEDQLANKLASGALKGIPWSDLALHVAFVSAAIYAVSHFPQLAPDRAMTGAQTLFSSRAQELVTPLAATIVRQCSTTMVAIAALAVYSWKGSHSPLVTFHRSNALLCLPALLAVLVTPAPELATWGAVKYLWAAVLCGMGGTGLYYGFMNNESPLVWPASRQRRQILAALWTSCWMVGALTSLPGVAAWCVNTFAAVGTALSVGGGYCWSLGMGLCFLPAMFGAIAVTQNDRRGLTSREIFLLTAVAQCVLLNMIVLTFVPARTLSLAVEDRVLVRFGWALLAGCVLVFRSKQLDPQVAA